MNIESVVEVKPNLNIPDITSGDTVRVHTRIVEGDKERIQVFQGVVIKIRNRGIASSFTVRRVAYGVGVERTFPFHSPRVEKVELVRRGKKRRAKLYYLRGLSAKTSRLREKRLTQKEMAVENERLEKLEALKKASQVEEIEVEELEEAPEVEAEAVELETEEAAAVEAEKAPAEEPATEEAPAAEAEKEAPAVEAEAVEEPAAEAEEEPAAEPEQEAEEAPEQEEKKEE